jgi:1,2-phenylacetyl-CoA epoxidase catalytic subunit
MYIAVSSMKFFVLQSWDFKNKNLQLLRQNSLPADAKEFNIDDFELIDFKKYFLDTYRVVRQTILKDSSYTTPEGWTQYRR